ncbi:electron transfer flavoprotein subunit alpha/FixB family protein|uniref:Electron transfer flavoprotein alpha subunit apoprotein n=1 Tax=Dendrosporobacter quercicolus TaxID=146817 RepID=A0A1H0A0D6_9FIRM|nr:electron transfer flavoprotein subunit alpha/FixB family protein [Dendrosporobacter quercicolus]NSL50089.1 electron transfer flavoprotein subunit alpha/FixB family protein [Dendrosporobacter quercicolus DSM 1736]SDN26744.1 electron transfer flavoprotein alpha subunit apoprotein [Dendrosporobacter quercicolus]
MQNDKAYRGIWVVAEQTADGLSGVSFELLTKARQLKEQGGISEPVTAVILGENLAGCQAKLAEAGAEAVIIVDHPELRLFQNDIYAAILKTLVELKKPEIVLMGATAAGSDLAPTLGARLKTGVSAHCVDLRLNDDGNLVAVVPAFGGKVLGDILCPERRPQMATIRPGILGKAACYLNVECSVEQFDPSAIIAEDQGRVKAIGITREEQKGVPLEEADVVVVGGFGLMSKENWQLIETLALMLGGAVGCTRPPLDEGWAKEYQMIGTSGKSVRPKVYIGVGISGATHHVCGMKDAGLVISINKDEKAPIFEVSDIGVTADATAILPLLIEVMQRYDDNVVC